MKKQSFFLAFSLLFSAALSAQTYAGVDHTQSMSSSTNYINEPLETQVSEQLLSQHNLNEYIAANLKYPALANEVKVEGRVVAKVLIGTDGSVVHAEILESLGYGCDESVLQLIQEMPRWTPFVRNGKVVTQELQIPVRFALR